LLAIAAAAAGLAAANGPAASTAPQVQGNCADKSVTVLFWPQGHGVIRTLRFPTYRPPHLEIYRYAARNTFASANQRGFAAANGESTFAKACKREQEQRTFQVLPARSIRTKATVTCSFTRGAKVQLKKVAGAGARWDVRLIDPPNKVVLRAIIAPQGSHLSASRQQCAIGAAPA
jgi:hypothetical protein